MNEIGYDIQCGQSKDFPHDLIYILANAGIYESDKFFGVASRVLVVSDGNGNLMFIGGGGVGSFDLKNHSKSLGTHRFSLINDLISIKGYVI